MTEQQASSIKYIKQYMVHGCLEVKEEDIADMGDFLSYSVVVGMPEDEGTLASVLCREYRHFFIGKRGGVQLRTVSIGNKTSNRKVAGLQKALHHLPF